MRTKMAIGLVIVTAILLGGCAAPQKEVVPPKPVAEPVTPREPARISDLDSKLSDLTKQIINSLTETKRTRIAIIEFSDLEGNITQFGRYLSEELITRLFMTGRFVVVERRFLNKIIEEHKLSYTHFFDEESVQEIGKLLGVSAIASGSLTDLGDSVKVNARLIATESGSVFAVAAVEILKDERVAGLLAKKAKSPYYDERIAPKPREVPLPAPEKPIPEKPKEKPKVALQKVEADNFTFEVKECKMSGANIICNLLITNNDQDRELRLYNKDYRPLSRIFDDFGNAYGANQVQIGSKKGSHPRTLLISGVPTGTKLYFEKVSTQASRITLLEVGCESNGKRIIAKLRNVPLSGAPPPTPAKPKGVVLQKVEADNFTFEVKECKMSGANIICNLLITNNDQDRELRLYNKDYRPLSRIFDDFGNAYGANQVQIGSKKGSHPRTLLISGVPTGTKLYFEKVSTQASRITLLEVGCESNGKRIIAKLRNVPLLK